MFGVNSDIGVITFVGEKWRNSGRSRGSIVVSELTKREKAGPVVLLVINCRRSEGIAQGFD